MKRTPLQDRLCKRLHVAPNGCWEWQGYRDKNGYGRIRKTGPDGTWDMISPHRAMWEIVFGPIPDGLWVLHRCDNPPCANPAHLFLGTNGDNQADMTAKGRGRGGEKNGRSKLTWAKVEDIRADARPNTVIAAECGVTNQLISRIKRGEVWK
jgi:hypothetical protein